MPTGVYTRTKEHNKRLSKSCKGRIPWNKDKKVGPLSEEHKRKISKGLDGHQPSKATKRKISKALKGNTNGFQKGHKRGMTGRHESEEHKKKISKALKGRKKTREHIRNSLKKREMSTLEIKVNNVIKKHSLPYKFVGNGKFFIERKNPDFVNINGEKVAIEVYCRRHKEYFRGGCDNWKEDRLELFAKYGWKIIFIEDWQTNKEEDILSLLDFGKVYR